MMQDRLNEMLQVQGGESRKGIVAIIPARSGSKGLPCKNIMPLCGLPLLAYSVIVAKQARTFDKVVVSTEDEDIAAVALAYGAEVPFLRPMEMATDTASPGAAIAYTLTRLHEMGVCPEAYVVLFPTHPLRKVEVVRSLAAKLLQGYAHVQAAHPLRQAPYSFLHETAEGNLAKIWDNGVDPKHFQYYRPSGYFVGSRLDFGNTHRELYIHPLHDPVQALDVDSSQDMLLAEALTREKQYELPTC